MKNKLQILTFLFVFMSNFSFGQSIVPEKVYSIVKTRKDHQWYVDQHTAWGKVLEKDKKNPAAWESYYAATRMAKITSSTDEELEKWFEKTNEVIAKMEVQIPNTYEYYHLKCWHSNFWGMEDKAKQDEFISWAQKAYKLDPNRTEIYPDLMNVSMFTNDIATRKELAKKWLASGDLSPTVLSLCYNLLISVEENGVLITCGDNDTYPCLVLQAALNFRSDVSVANVYCAKFSMDYRQHFFEKTGIPKTSEVFQDDIAFVNYIVNNAGGKPVYFSFIDFLANDENLTASLYNVGLAYKYSSEDFNNTSALINNFENKFVLDQLKYTLYKESFPEAINNYKMAYVPGLVQLYGHYKITEETKKLNEVKELIVSIVTGTEYEQIILDQLN